MSEPAPLNAWIRRLAADLGISEDVDVKLVLEVARESAHRVARPAAPVTAYMIGVAVGRGGQGTDLRPLADRVLALMPEPDPAPDGAA